MKNPVHPGEIIRDLIESRTWTSIRPPSLSKTAKHLGVHRSTLSRLISGKSGISSDMAFRLPKLFPNTDAIFWLNLQRDYDIWVFRNKAE